MGSISITRTQSPKTTTGFFETLRFIQITQNSLLLNRWPKEARVKCDHYGADSDMLLTALAPLAKSHDGGLPDPDRADVALWTH